KTSRHAETSQELHHKRHQVSMEKAAPTFLSTQVHQTNIKWNWRGNSGPVYRRGGRLCCSGFDRPRTVRPTWRRCRRTCQHLDLIRPWRWRLRLVSYVPSEPDGSQCDMVCDVGGRDAAWPDDKMELVRLLRSRGQRCRKSESARGLRGPLQVGRGAKPMAIHLNRNLKSRPRLRKGVRQFEERTLRSERVDRARGMEESGRSRRVVPCRVRWWANCRGVGRAGSLGRCHQRCRTVERIAPDKSGVQRDYVLAQGRLRPG